MDGHSSGAPVAGRLVATHPDSGAETRLRASARVPSYSVLLPVGFTLPSTLPPMRCALTAPFHPCRVRRGGGLLSVALSLGCPRRPLTGTVFPWSPDFPPPDGFPHCRKAAIRPSGPAAQSGQTGLRSTFYGGDGSYHRSRVPIRFAAYGVRDEAMLKRGDCIGKRCRRIVADCGEGAGYGRRIDRLGGGVWPDRQTCGGQALPVE